MSFFNVGREEGREEQDCEERWRWAGPAGSGVRPEGPQLTKHWRKGLGQG